jgi:hypothetical protein
VVWLGVVWLGVVWLGVVWLGVVRLELAGLGLVGVGAAGLGLVGAGRRGFGVLPPLPVDDPVLEDRADGVQSAPPHEPDRAAVVSGLDVHRLVVHRVIPLASGLSANSLRTSPFPFTAPSSLVACTSLPGPDGAAVRWLARECRRASFEYMFTRTSMQIFSVS